MDSVDSTINTLVDGEDLNLRAYVSHAQELGEGIAFFMVGEDFPEVRLYLGSLEGSIFTYQIAGPDREYCPYSDVDWHVSSGSALIWCHEPKTYPIEVISIDGKLDLSLTEFIEQNIGGHIISIRWGPSSDYLVAP